MPDDEEFMSFHLTHSDTEPDQFNDLIGNRPQKEPPSNAGGFSVVPVVVFAVILIGLMVVHPAIALCGLIVFLLFCKK